MDATRRRGVALLVGGVVVALALEPVGGLAFAYLVPLAGLTYLAGAALGGRRGALWAPGLMVTAWGLGVVAVREDYVSVSEYPLALLLLGVGASVAVALASRGFAVDAAGVAGTLVLAGAFFLLVAEGPDLARDGWPWGVVLAGWGLWELRGGRR